MVRIPQVNNRRDLRKISTARDMFVQGVHNEDDELEFPTISSLTGVAGVSKQTLYTIAESEDWKGDRNRVQIAIKSKRDADHAALAVREGKSLDELSIKGAKLIIGEVVRRMLDIDAAGIDSQGERMKATTLQQLAVALKTAQHAGKIAIGEPTEINGDYADDETVRTFARLFDQYAEYRAAASSTVKPELADAVEGEPDSAT